MDTLQDILPASRLSPIEVERKLLATMLNDPATITDASAVLSPDDAWQLADSRHQRLYPVLVRHWLEHKAIDGELLLHELVRGNILEAVGGEGYLQELFQTVPGGDVRHYVRIIGDMATLRRLRSAAMQAAADIDNSTDPVSEIIDRAQRAMSDAMASRKHLEVGNLADVMRQTLAEIEAHGGSVPGLPTGLAALDHRLGGLHRGELIILAARPGMGKSALAMNIVEYLALRQGVRPAVFSLEMSKQQLALRTMYSMARLDSRAAGERRLSAGQLDALRKATAMFDGKDIPTDFTAAIRVADLQSKCRRLQINGGLDAVFVDYLQLATGDRGRGVPRHEEVASVSRGLKGLALELNIPVVALCQLNRQVESRDGCRPRLADLRESGQIEQDADVVLLLHRPWKYNQNEPQNLAEVIIAKQRNGPTGGIRLAFHEQFCRFSGYLDGAPADDEVDFVPDEQDAPESPFW